METSRYKLFYSGEYNKLSLQKFVSIYRIIFTRSLKSTDELK